MLCVVTHALDALRRRIAITSCYARLSAQGDAKRPLSAFPREAWERGGAGRVGRILTNSCPLPSLTLRVMIPGASAQSGAAQLRWNLVSEMGPFVERSERQASAQKKRWDGTSGPKAPTFTQSIHSTVPSLICCRPPKLAVRSTPARSIQSFGRVTSPGYGRIIRRGGPP